MVADEIESLESVLKVLAMEVDLLGIAILIDLSVSLRHLCYESTESIAFLLFVLGLPWLVIVFFSLSKSWFDLLLFAFTAIAAQ